MYLDARQYLMLIFYIYLECSLFMYIHTRKAKAAAWFCLYLHFTALDSVPTW